MCFKTPIKSFFRQTTSKTSFAYTYFQRNKTFPCNDHVLFVYKHFKNAIIISYFL